MSTYPIGILDSGVGGLTILKHIHQLLPQENLIYVGDTLHCPYGDKSPEEIYNLAKQLITYLLRKNVKLVVIACNTITVTCIDQLRETYPELPIIGVVPVVKTAASVTKNKKIGVFSTTRTASSESQKKLIEQYASGVDVVSVGTNDIVPFIERGDIHSPEFKTILERELQPFIAAQVDTVALGCTHFPFITSQIQEIVGKDVTLLDPGDAVARHVERILNHNDLMSDVEKGRVEYVVTGSPEQFEDFAKNVMKEHISVSQIPLGA